MTNSDKETEIIMKIQTMRGNAERTNWIEVWIGIRGERRDRCTEDFKKFSCIWTEKAVDDEDRCFFD